MSIVSLAMASHAALNKWVLRGAQGLALLGGGLLLAAMALTLLSTLGKNARRALDSLFGAQEIFAPIHSILGEEELVGLAVGFALLCALPLTQLSRSHIRIEIFATRFPPWLNRALDVVADAAMAALLALILLNQWLRVVRKPRGSTLGFWDHMAALDLGAAFDRLRPGVTQILGLNKAALILGAQGLLLLALLVALYCCWRSLMALIRGHAHD